MFGVTRYISIAKMGSLTSVLVPDNVVDLKKDNYGNHFNSLSLNCFICKMSIKPGVRILIQVL